MTHSKRRSGDNYLRPPNVLIWLNELKNGRESVDDKQRTFINVDSASPALVKFYNPQFFEMAISESKWIVLIDRFRPMKSYLRRSSIADDRALPVGSPLWY